ncbi:adenylyl-sulfate kinase, partial [Yersinia pestis]
MICWGVNSVPAHQLDDHNQETRSD